MPEMAKRRRVVVPDLVGFGYTDTPADFEFRFLDSWVDQILAVLDALAIERTDIVGNSFGGSLALFEIKKPNAISDTAGNYGLDGEQRNRGVEMNVFGEPMLGLRLNASTVWLDAKQNKTA